MAAHHNAVSVGLSPVEFWSLTPYLARNAISALADGRITQAWMTANLSRAKTLPKLEKLLSKTEPKSGDIGMKLKSALAGIKRK